MIEPWTRWDVTVLQRDFGYAVREAQKHCPILRQVRVISSEEVYCELRSARNRVVLLINPELMAACGLRRTRGAGVRDTPTL